MTDKETDKIFAYSWHVDDSDGEKTMIRIYGINETGKTICLHIHGVTPYIYIELDSGINWDVKTNVTGLINAIFPPNKLEASLYPCDDPCIVYMKKLYGASLDQTGKYNKFPYLFCAFGTKNAIKRVEYRLRKPIKNIPNKYNSFFAKVHESDASPDLQLCCFQNIPTAGWIQFFGKKVDIKDMSTTCDAEYDVDRKKLVRIDCDIVPKARIMAFDIEVNSSNPARMPQANEPDDEVFQISAIIGNVGENKPLYKYLLTLGDPDSNIVGKDIIIRRFDTERDLFLGFRDLVTESKANAISGYNILGFDFDYMIERAKGFATCIHEFSVLGFPKREISKERIIKWTSSAYKNQEFRYLDCEGRVIIDLLPLIRRDFIMSNYKLKTISSYFLGETKDPLQPEGIFKCYRIGMKRTDEGDFSLKAKKAMGIVGKYCVQDSVLVLSLMERLKTWIGLSEMAKTCNVSMFTLYTQGQQIKVFSQIYKYCMNNGIVVEKNGYSVSENERYVGAHVFDPIPGRHDNVVPFDFASLYPTTIIAYNIDYHTYVPNDDETIPNDLCHIMEWEDHVGCDHDPKMIRKMELTKYITAEEEKIKKIRTTKNELRVSGMMAKYKCDSKQASKHIISEKDKLSRQIVRKVSELSPYKIERADINKNKPKFIMCEHRKYKFLKEPKGVLPTIIQNLLNARNHTRKVEMKNIRTEIVKLKDTPNNEQKISELETLLNVLDKRQLGYKVSANSMYGAMGVRKGYLPFMPGAMCTTFMGRTNIELVAKTIPEKYGGKLIYGDTDSNYICFPDIKTTQETWDYAERVAEEVSSLFPKPIKLEFEEAIYAFFFILTKKRYMYRECKRDGVVNEKIGKKGVLLARRDNSAFVRNTYEEVISRISCDKSQNDVLMYVFKRCHDLMSHNIPLEDFIITKSIGSVGDYFDNPNVDAEPELTCNEKGQPRVTIGNYSIVPLDRRNPEERQSQLDRKKAENPKEFYFLSLPAQVQLGLRMKRRGQRVDTGQRLEYVVTNMDNHTGKQYEKLEHIDYFKKYSNILTIDYLYYFKALATPLDQVLDVAFGSDPTYKKGLIMTLYKRKCFEYFHINKKIKNFSTPSLVFFEALKFI